MPKGRGSGGKDQSADEKRAQRAKRLAGRTRMRTGGTRLRELSMRPDRKRMCRFGGDEVYVPLVGGAR